jgi:hypothetical protein
MPCRHGAGVEVQLYSFLTWALDGGWLTPRLGRLTSGKEPRYPLYMRLGGPPDLVWTGLRKKKNLLTPPGFAPPNSPARNITPSRLQYSQ